MRILTRTDSGGAVTLFLVGTLNGTCVPDFERALESAHRHTPHVVLDLTRLGLIDRPALQFLIDVMQRDVQVVKCPPHIERWIQRERTMGSEAD
jgi:anti-anti-sigma regulatory factor